MSTKKLKVLGRDYSISRKRQVLELNGKPIDGYCDSDSIWISPDAENELRTFFHEVVHAVCNENSVRQVPNWSGDVEEILAESIGRVLSENRRAILAMLQPRKRRG